MTRDEKEQRVQREDGKAFAVYNVDICERYLNPTYTLSNQTGSVITRMGLLKVFELTPSGAGPSFIARWDGGSRDQGKKETFDLDIDIAGVLREEKRRFNKEQGGYTGHHTTKVESDWGWKYEVAVRTPDGLIFEGSVRFNLHRKVGAQEHPHISESVEATVIRAEDWPQPKAPGYACIIDRAS